MSANPGIPDLPEAVDPVFPGSVRVLLLSYDDRARMNAPLLNSLTERVAGSGR